MLLALSVLLGILGIVVGFAAFSALVRARLFRFLFGAVASLLLLVAGAMLALVSLGIQGMRALTNEETAARIRVVPTAPQRYDATLIFADGRTETFALAGDDIYVDGHIVKWTPLANMLGLHTSYRLDRISGRYRALEQENTAPRTVYSIGQPVLVDLVALGRTLPLADFFDAEYGSATFVPVNEPGELELKVSTTGLLIRPVPAPIAVPKS
ncbi:MAG: hypothetical protein ACXWUL_04110 [Caldimonas sp.]